jgi:hypothetical protein
MNIGQFVFPFSLCTQTGSSFLGIKYKTTMHIYVKLFVWKFIVLSLEKRIARWRNRCSLDILGKSQLCFQFSVALYLVPCFHRRWTIRWFNSQSSRYIVMFLLVKINCTKGFHLGILHMDILYFDQMNPLLYCCLHPFPSIWHDILWL